MARQVYWTNKLVLEFIELYKNERSLWDPTDPQYRRSDIIATAWNRIRTYRKFNNCCVKELKKKKESLMSAFRLIMNKKRKNPSYQTLWFAFSALESFLGPKYESEKSNQLEEESLSQDYQSLESDESNDDETSLETSDPISIPKETPRITSEVIVIPNEEKNVAIYKPQSSTSKKTFTLTLQSNNNSEPNTQVNKRATREETDEYDLYGQLLAKKLKTLHEHQRDLAMHEIDDIMFRTKMQSGNEYKIEQRYPALPSSYTMKPQLVVVQNSTQYGDENVTYQDLDAQQQLS